MREQVTNGSKTANSRYETRGPPTLSTSDTVHVDLWLVRSSARSTVSISLPREALLRITLHPGHEAAYSKWEMYGKCSDEYVKAGRGVSEAVEVHRWSLRRSRIDSLDGLFVEHAVQGP